MNNWPPYNPYANCCTPCGYNPNANCATQNINYANALNVDDIIEKLRPKAYEPYQHYEIVAVQEPDE